MRNLFQRPTQDFKSSSGLNGFPLLLSLSTIALFLTLVISFALPLMKYEYEERVGSLIWALMPEQEQEERITIVAIDERSLAEVGPWPWSRDTMTKLSNRLGEYGSSLQLYDIVFPEAKAGDEGFLAALEKHNGVIAQVPIFDRQSVVLGGHLSGALDAFRCQFPIPNATSYLANNSNLLGVKTGHITPIVDHDGMIRKQPPLVCIDGRVYPSLALQGLLSSLGHAKIGSQAPTVSIHSNKGLFESPLKVVIDSYFGLSIPIDENGDMRLSFRQSPNSFQVVSAASILNGSAPKELLENTWTLIGATAFGMGDVVPTPHSGMTPGVELQARLLSNLLDGRTPFTPSIAPFIVFAEGVAIALLFLILGRKQNKISAYSLPIATVLTPLIPLAIHAHLLTLDVWLGWLNASLFALILGCLCILADHRVLRLQHFRIFSHLSSYLPQSVAQGLIDKTPSSAIEASRHDLVLLCADLRNFSAYEESRPPEEAAALLHYFFIEASAVIESYGGQVEEFKGDSLLASWAVKDTQNASQQSLLAANKLQEVITTILPSRPPKGLEPLALGIAIERGSTLVGSIGPAHRRNHTLLGDTVTIVLRIQELTQDLAQPILIGECAARDLYGDEIESQGSFLLDGLMTPHVLFAPKSHHVDPLQDKEESRVLQLVRNRH